MGALMAAGLADVGPDLVHYVVLLSLQGKTSQNQEQNQGENSVFHCVDYFCSKCKTFE